MGIDARDGDRDLRAEHDPQEGPELVLRHTLELDRVVVARALCAVRTVHRRQLEHRGKHLRFMLERPTGDFEQDVIDLGGRRAHWQPGLKCTVAHRWEGRLTSNTISWQ